ncbi:MAG: N-6 DNA methylase [Candidatus Binatia bacterium]
MTDTPKVLAELVERFERNIDAYQNHSYNETLVRIEFINPLFEALGWDLTNKSGYAEAYKDVIHEDAIKMGGATKAPDYCFRIGGARKFFLEAKRPAVNIKDDVNPAYQLRRYAWSAKLPLSILTDFGELAVYDCRVLPKPADKASTARILYLTYENYADRWDEIAGIFSREAVLKGSFDKFAEARKGKRGTSPVDKEFLAEIETWRDALAKNLALRNPKLSVRDLNFAVQRTIDRIIFLRMCEDRGVENYGQLQALLNGENIYKRLQYLYGIADDKYNSGIFHFKQEKDRAEAPDGLTLKLKIDDKILKDILRRLYYPESPYEFSVLGADILGTVYEQFLGKVIRLTPGHRAIVEEKPEVKKAGGVYYTPAYIVDYIVKNTVGKLGEGKSPRQIEKLRILDPACGSGSFLVGAYTSLLDYHRDWYVKDGSQKHTKEIYQGVGNQWYLTTQEKKRILLNNIYGVDIDSQAVEVTKLSLLLKVLEGENQDSLTRQLKMWRERALPDLGNNIKCGNSLIDPDFYQNKQMGLLEEEDRYKINAFDWNTEFPAVMKAGGFDAVIGNPPYVRQESLSDFKEYFEKHYEASDGTADLYAYFMEKGVKLLRDGGLFSIIVSSSFLRATYGESLRRMLTKHAAVLRIVDFGGLPIFANAKDTYVCIPLLAKGAKPSRVEVSKVHSFEAHSLSEHVATNNYTVPHERFSPEAWSLKSESEAAVFEKILKAGKPLGDYVERKMFYGLKTGFNEAFEISEQQRASLIKSSPASKLLIKPFLGGQDIRRYLINDEGRYLIVIPSGWTKQQLVKTRQSSTDFSEKEAWNWFSRDHGSIAEHLKAFIVPLRKRQDQGDYWWELRPCDYYRYLEAPKIIFPDICKEPRFFLDRSGIYLANTAYCLGTDDLYLLGILNSRLFWFGISNISIPFGIRAGQYRYRLIYQYMEKVPIRVINFSDAADKARHTRIVTLVQRMLELCQELANAKNPNDKIQLQREIEATDHQIDQLVYELYGLTADEIDIVEGQPEGFRTILPTEKE